MKHIRNTFFATTLIIGVFFASSVQANFIGDLEGLQRFGDATWNPVTDEYAFVYTGGDKVCVARIDSGGTVQSIVNVAPPVSGNPYNLAAIQANPADGSYLVTFRNDEPARIQGTFLDQAVRPISNPFLITGSGGSPDISYNPIANLYLVSYNLGFKSARFRMVSGVVSDTPLSTPEKQFSNEYIARSAFSTGANKFLYVTGREHQDGTNGSDIWGRFVTSDGSSVGSRFPIANSARDETGVRIGYAPSSNYWLVMWQKHIGGNRSFDTEAALIDVNGNIVTQFFIATTSGWEVPQAVEYNASIDKFVVAWFNATPRVALVDPQTGAVEHILPNDQITTPQVSNLGDAINGVATRAGIANPQIFVAWREGHGLNGVNGTIVDIESGTQIPISGGGIPCVEPQEVQDFDTTVVLDDETGVEEESDLIEVPSTPVPLPELKVEKFVRNVSKNQTTSNAQLTQVSEFDIVQFIIRITSQANRTVTGLTVYDQMPEGMTFRENSTLIDGTTTPGAEVVSDFGLAGGDISAGAVRIVRWSAQITDLSLLSGGLQTVEVPVVVTTDDAGTFFSDAQLGLSDEFIAARSAPVNQVSAVQDGLNETIEKEQQNQVTDEGGIFGAVIPSTGAGGTVVFSLIGAVLMSLAYAGYTRSGTFHRRQISDITEKRDPMDFRG